MPPTVWARNAIFAMFLKVIIIFYLIFFLIRTPGYENTTRLPRRHLIHTVERVTWAFRKHLAKASMKEVKSQPIRPMLLAAIFIFFSERAKFSKMLRFLLKTFFGRFGKFLAILAIGTVTAGLGQEFSVDCTNLC